MHQAHEEDADNQSEEKQVVLLSNTIVKPDAMMVELVDASVAFAAMFRGVANSCLANVTLKFKCRTVEDLSIIRHQNMASGNFKKSNFIHKILDNLIQNLL